MAHGNRKSSHSQLREALLDYLVDACRLLDRTKAKSVNLAIESGAAVAQLESKMVDLERIVGETRGDYLFVLLAQATGIKVERTHRLTDYPTFSKNPPMITCAMRH